MRPATPQETCDHTIGTGALSYDWYEGTEHVHTYDDAGNAYDDWHVTLLMENCIDESTASVRADLNHAAVMRTARYVLENKGKTIQTRTGREYPAWSLRLERECRNLVFNADEADLDADVADELIQLIAYGEVVFG